MRESVTVFEKASGINILHAWNVGKVGDAVNRVLHGYDERVRGQLESLRTQALNIASGITAELAKQ